MIFKCHIDDCWRVEIGKKPKGLLAVNDINGNTIDVKEQPMIVSKEVTRRDFEDYIHSQGEEVLFPENLHEFRFFEVLTD